MNPNDTGIPVLTEIIPTPASAAPVRQAAVPSPAPLPASLQLATPQPPIPATNEGRPVAPDAVSDQQQWESLEQDVCERVLNQVMGRIDEMLEDRLQNSLNDVLLMSLERLTADLRNGLRYSLKEIVARATAQEIANLQKSKK